jgi:hypothetical protein
MPYNGEKKRAQNLKWRSANRDKDRECTRKWRKANPERVAAKNARQRARKVALMAPTCDHAAVSEQYRVAALAGALMGERFNVDHLTPLSRGGLHHHENLQVLPAVLNASKHTKTHIEALDSLPDYKQWCEGPPTFEAVTVLPPVSLCAQIVQGLLDASTSGKIPR